MPETGIDEWLPRLRPADPHHRHLSHLLRAYPGEALLTDSQRASIAESLAQRGDDGPAWSLGWKAALHARLHDRQAMRRLFDLMLRPRRAGDVGWEGGAYPNLLLAHPPFQLDGNLAALAAITECLLQSHAGEIELLPALPTGIASGRFTHLVARPGVAVSATWRDGALTVASLRALHGGAVGTHRVRYADSAAWVTLTESAETFVRPDDLRQEQGQRPGVERPHR
jgi:alpha-L-fucosidase 2